MKIWIGGKLGVRDWIDVILAIHSLTIVGSTLPLPDILIGSELVITNQVGAAITLVIKLTGTLIEDELQEGIIGSEAATPNICCASTLTKEVDPIDGALLARSNHVRIASIGSTIPWVSVVGQASHTLGIHQINIRETEEWEVGIHAIIAGIGCGRAIILQVAPFL